MLHHKIQIAKLGQVDHCIRGFFQHQGLPSLAKIRSAACCILERQCHRDSLPLVLELSIVLCDDEHIASLNQNYRSEKDATDVLSFPLLDFPVGPGTSDLSRQKLTAILSKWPHEKQSRFLLGDIIISCSTCIRQAQKRAQSESGDDWKIRAIRNQSIDREFFQLLIHGVLHLFGYDHETKKSDYLQMQKRERELYRDLTNRRLG